MSGGDDDWIDWEPLCGIAAGMESGGPTLNVGDSTTNAGVGASLPVLCPGGFLGGFASAASGGAAARVFTATIGQDKVVAFGRDEREWLQVATWQGAAPLPTDRFITAYGFKAHLEQRTGAADTIGLYGDGTTLTSPRIVLDAAGGTVTVQVNDTLLVAGATGCGMSWSNSTISAQCAVTENFVLLTYDDGVHTCSITLGPGGTIAIVAPGGVTVNGTPVP